MLGNRLNLLKQHVDGSSVAFVRIAFGLVMVYWLASHLAYDKISYYYYEPKYLFPYFGWEWLGRWPGRGLHWHFVVALIAALGILFGVFYRFCSVLFAVCFAYIFLLDKTTYQNHYYFVCLMSILLAVCPVHRSLSFDALRLQQPQTVPRWVVYLFRFQIGLVYFYGGVAKINVDWLAGYPMNQVLAEMTDHFLVGPFCQQQWFVFCFVWAGMLFDLLIVPMLLFKKTRRLGFLLAVTFHLTNASLFRIGIFPWMMIFVTTIFFEPNWIRSLWPSLFKTTGSVNNGLAAPTTNESLGAGSALLSSGLVLFVVLQIVLPLRHFAYAENTSWTERNHYFAWHMKLRAKKTLIRFYVIDPESGRGRNFNYPLFIKNHQIKRMAFDPFMIRDFARFIKSYHEFKGIPNVSVRVFALCSLNGRKPQLLINPDVDLAAPELPIDWIVPLEAQIGGDWNEPREQWERLVMRDPILDEFMKMAEGEQPAK